VMANNCQPQEYLSKRWQANHTMTAKFFYIHKVNSGFDNQL